MDTTRDRKKPNERSGLGSEKQSRGSIGPQTVEANGEVYELPPDFDELEEIDYDDPAVKKWLEELENESVRLYGRMTVAEFEYMGARRLELQKVYPEKSNVELNQMALKEFRGKSAPRI